MKLPITSIDKIDSPLEGFAFAFIDAEDNKLKVKKHDSVIEFSNTLDDVQLLDLADYTAFEVFAHDYDIPAGECEELGGYVNVAIPSSNFLHLIIRSHELQENQNVMIDFGNGEKIDLRTYDFSDLSIDIYEDEIRYHILYRYESNGKYIVKIYGNTYFGIMSEGDNLISRAISKDLPIASHLRNFSSFLKGANHLLKIDVSNTIFNLIATQTSNMFSSCKNLIEAKGFSDCNSITICNNMFAGCSNLLYTDFIIPSKLWSSESIKSLFHNCSKLEVKLDDILGTGTFLNQEINLEKIFVSCKKMSMSNLDFIAKALWNNKNVTWILPSNVKYLPFAGSSDVIRGQVPISWGRYRIK